MRTYLNQYISVLLFIFSYFGLFPQVQALEKIAIVIENPSDVNVSADGRFVVYATSQNPANVINTQVFMLDRNTGETILISQNSSGEAGDHSSFDPRISSDGSYIVFSSNSNNLIDNDLNLSGDDTNIVKTRYIGQDIYGYDVGIGAIELLSISSLGVQGQGISFEPKTSEDGRYILFRSFANNLVPDDQSLPVFTDLFLHDRETRTTLLVNRNASGEHVPGAGFADLSGDGTKVVFVGSSSRLLENIELIPTGYIFLKDLQTGEIELISRAPDGSPSEPSFNGLGADISAISRTGDVIAYASVSPTYTISPDGGYEYLRLFLYDRNTGQTTLVSVDDAGNTLGGIRSLDLSEDGRYLAFVTGTTNIPEVDRQVPDSPRAFLYDRETGTTVQSDREGLQTSISNIINSVAVTDDGREVFFLTELTTYPDAAIFSFINPNVQGPRKISIKKTINGESSIAGGTEPLANTLAGRPYRADYTVTNTSSTRIYGVKVFDDDQGSNQLACNLYALDPGQSRQCSRFYQTQLGTNTVPARVEARISGDGTPISATTPQVSYVGQASLSGGLTVKHALNNKPGDDESNAVELAANTHQSWLFKVTNTSNVDVYKVKVYNDGVFPQNTGWEELCLIGKLKIGETRYCKRPMAAGQEGLNLMMGRAQANDSFVVGSHQYINAANPTYYIIEP